MWTTERQHGFTDCDYAEEMQEHMRIDLVALSGLTRQLPERMGARVITEKGYAVDALCGHLTRLHYDADILVATPEPAARQGMVDAITSVLEEATDRPWGTYEWEKENADSWIKLFEKGKRRWHEGVTGTARDAELANTIDAHMVHAPDPFAEDTYIELHARSGAVYGQAITRATLQDPFGGQHTLTIPSVNEQLASKIHISRSLEHRLRNSDFYDFEMLFTDPRFDATTSLLLLQDYFGGRGHTEQETAQIIRAELQWLGKHVELPAPLRFSDL